MKNLQIVLLGIAIFLSGNLVAQDFSINTTESTLTWEGKKVTGKHWGNVKIKEGTFSMKEGKMTSGTFKVDMASITCDDLEGEWSQKLVGHLKSDDFFGVEKFPVATLVIKESEIFKGSEPAKVKGDLTIKGKTHPIEFVAKMDDGRYKAIIIIDRTLYDIKYGSGKFFDNLGDKTIDDNFTLKVNVLATK